MIATTTKITTNNTILIFYIAAVSDCKNSSKYNVSTKKKTIMLHLQTEEGWTLKCR